MKIIVCMKEAVDTKLSLDSGLSNPVVFREGLPLKLDPNDAASLMMALDLKTKTQAEITLISIGPARVASYLSNGLALGADRVVRVWDDNLSGLSSWQKARLLAGAIKLYVADIVFTGTASVDTGNGQIGPLMAGWLGLPCTGDVVKIELDGEGKSLILTRDIGRGKREKVKSTLPTIVAVKGEGRLPCATLDRLVESKYYEIPFVSPDDLGIAAAALKNDPTLMTRLLFPAPPTRKAPPLDSSLPAFERILQLLAGGISRRKGAKLEGSPDELAERLFELLKEAGVLKPARGR